MIRTRSATFVVYFPAALKGTTGNPPGNDARPASGARRIGTAASPGPAGPFRAAPRPLVCFAQYGAAGTMTGDPGSRVRGDGVLSGAASPVTVNGRRELFLAYNTRGDPGHGQQVMIRMARLAGAGGTTVLGGSHQLPHSGTGSFPDTTKAQTPVRHGSWFILPAAHGNRDSCRYATEWSKSRHTWAWPDSGGTTLLSSAGTRPAAPAPPTRPPRRSPARTGSSSTAGRGTATA